MKGKPSLYFRVARRAPIHFTLRGPARLIVISRAEVHEGSSGTFAYFLRVLGPHAPLKVQAMESSPTSDARLADGTHALLCESRRLVVSIPKGEQHVWISVSGVPGVFVRLLRQPPGAGDGMTAIAPAEAPRTVTVKEGTERLSYFTVTPGKPLRFRVTGPTPFALISRLDFGKTDRGPTAYDLVLSSGGKTLRALHGNTVPADSATYLDLPDRVPSRPDSVEVYLGPGRAEIQVELVGPPGGAAEVHARVDESAGAAEE